MKTNIFFIFFIFFFAAATVNAQEIKTFEGHKNYIFSVCFSPDGKYLASGSHDNSIKIWNTETGKEIRTLTRHTYSFSSVCFSPDGKYLASGSHDNSIKIWNTETGEEVRTLGRRDVYSVCFSPDGKYIASGNEYKSVNIWNTETGKEVRTLTGHTYSVTSVCFSPDGKYIASAGFGEIKLWNTETGQCIKTFKELTISVCFSPDGKYIASAGFGEIKLWNTETGQCIKTFEGHSRTRYVRSVCFSPDGKYIASGSEDETIKIWDVNAGFLGKKCFKTFTGHTSYVNSVCFSPDGKFLATGSSDNTVKLWDVGFLNISVSQNNSQNNQEVSQEETKVVVKKTDKTAPVITISYPAVERGFKEVSNETSKISIRGKASDESSIAEIKINDNSATLQANGDFGMDLFLGVGENQFTVTATDIKGNTSSQTFTIKRLNANVSPVVDKDSPQNVGKYYALLIGVSEYTDSRIPDLDGLPVKDAKRLEKILNDNYTFTEVLVLTNPTSKQILRALDDLRSKVTPTDNVLIFYAGHGDYDEKTGNGYWLPADAEMGKYKDAWIYNSLLTDKLKEIDSKHTLLISDACFSGAIGRDVNVNMELPKKLYESPSRTAMTSGNEESVPNKSIFFEFLFKSLKNNTKKYFAASEIFVEIREKVFQSTQKLPQYGVIPGLDDRGGDFIFIRK